MVDELGEEIVRRGVQYREVDRPVAVDHSIPQASGLGSGDVGEVVLGVLVGLGSCFADHREVLQECGSTLTVRFQIVERDSDDERVRFLRSSDHLLDEEVLTRHR